VVEVGFCPEVHVRDADDPGGATLPVLAQRSGLIGGTSPVIAVSIE
jgi:hypothetical protein